MALTIRCGPAKSSRPIIPIPDEIKHELNSQLNKVYHTTEDLPSKLFITNWHFTNVHYFTYIHTLELLGCPYLTDVSPLANITDLSLIEGKLLVDVSPLCYVRCLQLAHCPNIIDVSALTEVEELHIVRCCGIRKLSALKNVKIHLKENHGIVDLDELDQRNITIHVTPRIVFQTHNSKFTYSTPL